MEANNRRNQYQISRTSYIQGSTARQLEAAPDIRREERPVRQPSPRRREERRPKALSGMNFASLFVLTIAIAVTLSVCMNYLKLQNEVNRMEKNIITLEQTFKTLKIKNDSTLEQINTAYDLSYVYEVAVHDLGMVYPNNNTVITYQKSPEDYVRQYDSIPE